MRVMQKPENRRKIWKSIFALLPRKQKSGFFLILLILAVSAALSRLTPLAIGYLTDHVLAGQNASFASVAPILAAILAVNIVNELIKVARRLIVEDTAAQAEKTARQRAALSLLIAPLSYFRAHMTGNIHCRLNRSLEGTVKLIKLMFMDFAPAVTTGLAGRSRGFGKRPYKSCHRCKCIQFRFRWRLVDWDTHRPSGRFGRAGKKMELCKSSGRH